MRDVESQRRRAPRAPSLRGGGWSGSWKSGARPSSSATSTTTRSAMPSDAAEPVGKDRSQEEEIPLNEPLRPVITIFSKEHALRNAATELYGGQLVRPHECPERAEIVLERVRSVGLGEVDGARALRTRTRPQSSRRRLRGLPGAPGPTGSPPATWARPFPTAGRRGAWRSAARTTSPDGSATTRWPRRPRSAQGPGRPRRLPPTSP